MPVITISRQVGSLGDEIAKAVRDKLNYDYIDKQKISEALADQGFRTLDLERYDEKKPSIWQSLSVQKKKFSFLIRAAVYELATNENVLIVGRGGQAILKDFPGTLHVRIVAPYAKRLSRLMNQKGCVEKEAEQIIRQSDRESSGYISTYFAADWDDQDLYDLVINTGSIAVNTAVAIITSAVEAREFQKASQPIEKLKDLALTRKVQATLLDIPRLRIVTVRVERGVADLSGGVESLSAKEACEKAVKNIKGIKKVDNQLAVIPLVAD
jgi:cytidylate kinase